LFQVSQESYGVEKSTDVDFPEGEGELAVGTAVARESLTLRAEREYETTMSNSFGE